MASLGTLALGGWTKLRGQLKAMLTVPYKI